MLNINGLTWRVYLVSPNHPMLARDNGSVAVGVCDSSTQSIYINEYVDVNFMKKILCHEITHAAMFSYGIILNHDQEEIIADLIATYGEEIVEETNIIFHRIKKKELT